MELDKQKIGVVGGNKGLGSWVVSYFRSKGIDARFSCRGENSEFSSNLELAYWADIVVLAVPISAMSNVMEEVFPALDDKYLIDVCSVKKFVIEKYEQLRSVYTEVLPKYISMHPMFSHRIKSFDGNVVLFNYNDGAEDLEQQLKETFLADKGVVKDVQYIKHDKLMGLVQGLNHFNVFVSAKTMARFNEDFEDIKSVASPPYRIFIVFYTRYVMQNPMLYADIQMRNEYVYEVVRIFRDEMNKLFDIIQTRDRDQFMSYITDMQDFFSQNSGDIEVSSHLMQKLSQKLEEK
ncbi:prephenate dehydrogenase/arogenate dehydrogenase family protein [Flammeovirga yaeyamensis]|uniref:Prephenate dehydrogenase/arogenate dehydrogenase family protein n=1 Tax=Flammeovirga yaeyamensis TaxID=367791 RepID=A0AAX1N7M1_9BACT|nr:prephenate dehydrogenase/arogenate dehydrogenase family protein [Flammeovirga yaeyamensis]MBB3697827.1 prephenate dehydrogenase [Flammeovirga yaeyamensis]NMF35817.1 prephenate dehydrogenase/arogenate dehydrogenase family protein [Flammeovirga yaeyamensis]QWG03231.1 prephenate dehydrogenase/arogenate dehydrogenase family protein [Flammeovirga yaeyamensis]